MTSITFGPEVVDINAYAGDTFIVSFQINSTDSQDYATTGSWGMTFYDKSGDSVVNTNPTGITITPAGNGFKKSTFNYVATAAQTTFSGADQDSNTLSYIVSTTQVYKNNVLVPANQYTATNGTSVVLNSGAALNDAIKIECLSTSTPDGVTAVKVSKELTELLLTTGDVTYEFYINNNDSRHTFCRGDVILTSNVSD